MSMDTARRVADAVLFEGYVLYPYRSTSAKNQVRWQFGVLGPVGAAEAGAGEDSAMRTELLLEPAADGVVRVDLRLRFLQAQFRAVEQAVGTGFEPVGALDVGATRWVAWHEAVERGFSVLDVTVAELADGRSVSVDIPGGEEVELLHHPDGRVAGRLVRTRWPLAGRIHLAARTADTQRPLTVLTIRLENVAEWQPPTAASADGQTSRDLAARTSFIGTHLLAEARGARFLSLADPPAWAAATADACENQRCWPVLVGDSDGGHGDVVLASPIILSDHPTVAEESPGDFFDATEIDEMLTLRVKTLTDDEKAQARGTDPRAAAIIDRCDGMSDEVFQRLHGVVHGQHDGATSEVPWWDPGMDASVSPEHDTVRIAGTDVGRGTRVVIRPTRRADAQDLFLAGLTAIVAAVHSDVDGNTHLAVTIEDDPASDLHQWYGRFYYFGPEEVEPLPVEPAESAETAENHAIDHTNGAVR